MKPFFAAGLIASLLLTAVASAADADLTKPIVLDSFEPGQKRVAEGGEIVKSHATDGEHAMRIFNPGKGYGSLSITDRATLRKFKDAVLLKVDVFNPQDRPIQCTMRVDDAQSHNYSSRYNDDGVIIRPGASTIELNLTGLTRSDARDFTQRGKIDLSTLKLWSLTMFPKEPTELFYDNIRLEGSGLPSVAGLRAIDIGPTGSPVFPGFEAVTEKSVYSPATGIGWVHPARHDTVYAPDALSGDYGTGDEFRLNVPNGAYEVHVGLDPYGVYGEMPTFGMRRLLLNGVEVLNQHRTGKDFVAEYFAHEDEEDLPGQDVWDKFVAKRNSIYRFNGVVKDGVLRLTFQTDRFFPISFIVVYPESQQEAGRHFMATLDRVRRAKFASWMTVRLPKVDGKPPVASPADKERGFIPFVRRTDSDIPFNAVPTEFDSNEIGLTAAIGERVHTQLGLYPLATVSGLTFKATDLAGPNGASIRASTVKARKIRNFLKRASQTSMAEIRPMILQDFETLDLSPNQTRGLWINVNVPANAVPGDYKGKIILSAGARQAEVPINLHVYPFALEKVTETTLSVTGATPSRLRGQYPELEQAYWEHAERVMADIAEHGMNAVTGGPGARLKAVKNGKPVIDYSDMDRWLALAVKYGLTMPGDSYQGLDVTGLPRHSGADAVEVCEKESQRRYGVAFPELVKIVYADVAQHAKEQGWPKRVYYLLDEPRSTYHNVGSAIELMKIFTTAAPDTMFSGFFSTGDGREPLFQLTPVAICHTDALSLKLTSEAGRQLWDYSGGGQRHDIGRWAYFASHHGLRGFLRNGYMYVCSDPYFDFSDDEASWCQVYPSRHGVNDTIGWERTSQGVSDFRYYLTLEKAIQKAKAAGRKSKAIDDAADQLEGFMRGIRLEDKESAKLPSGAYDGHQRQVADAIVSLQR